MPVIGFLGSSALADVHAFVPHSARASGNRLRRGPERGDRISLGAGATDRLPGLAADLVRRQVAVIAAHDTPSAIAAKAATTTIPIVFASGGDPVRLGLVASLNRPGGNVTGVSFVAVELGAKRLELLHELLPATVRVAVLVDPNIPSLRPLSRDVQAAACHRDANPSPRCQHRPRYRYGLCDLSQKRTDALFVGPARFQQPSRTTRYAGDLPWGACDLFAGARLPKAGGLMSYGTSITDAYRQAGVYTGRILKGEKPADLPVMQPTKFELVINLKTAKAFGLTVPPTLLAIADEVIE